MLLILLRIKNKMTRLKGRKITAFIILNIIYSSIYFFTLFWAPEILVTLGKILIVAFFANGITFIGGNTLDKWIKSKWFNKDLFGENND